MIGHDEDAGDGGDRRTQRPVHQCDPVGRQPDRCGGTLALGHRLGGEAELARPVEQPKTERRHAADGEQDEAVDRDPDVTPQRQPVGRQPALDLARVGAVADHDGRLDRDEHPERGDHPDERAGPPQGSHHHPVGERPRNADQATPADRRQQERPAGRVVQLPLHEDPGDRGRAEREVQARRCRGRSRSGPATRTRTRAPTPRPSNANLMTSFIVPLLPIPPLRVVKHQSGRRVPDDTASLASPSQPEPQATASGTVGQPLAGSSEPRGTTRHGPGLRVANIGCIVLYVAGRCASGARDICNGGT